MLYGAACPLLEVQAGYELVVTYEKAGHTDLDL